jgi:hypothetical protein
VEDFAQEIVVHCVHTNAVAESQRGIEGIPLYVWANADLKGTTFAVALEVAYDAIRFKVEHIVVILHHGLAKRG